MKPVVLLSALALLAALVLPILWTAPRSTAPTEETADTADAQLTFTVLTETGIQQQTMADYLPGVLAGEMPALFEPEALKAQAVAARTYIRYRMAHRPAAHPEADICEDPACCKAYCSRQTMEENWGKQFPAYYEKMCAAVRDTDGQYLQYDGAPIQAVFHSSSAGCTQDSGEIWNDCPYLPSVSSPETAADVPDYVTETEVSPTDFRAAIQTAYPSLLFPADPAQWLGNTVSNSSDRADHTTVCGTEVPGTQMRSLFSLRSAAYKLEYTARGTFLFTVTGYGHGVGMSQYGANVFAKNGYRYDEILAHYYPSAQLVSG